MILLFIVVGGFLVFAIAAAFVGTEAFRLGHTATTSVFNIDEAVFDVAEGLSDDAAVGLTMDEVRVLIGFALDHFRDKGLSARPGEEIELGPDGPPVVVADDDAVAVVLGRADDDGLEVTDVAVLEVLDLLLDHLVRSGAVGPVVTGPVDPETGPAREIS